MINQLFLVSNATSWLITILFIILSYLLGSIPFGLVLGKLIAHVDIREHGSKNIGTTNTIRVLGKKIGYTVFVCDVLKAMTVILIVKFLLEPKGIITTNVPHVIYGLAALLGHVFSIFLKFKGGKAVASSFGLIIALCPTSAIIGITTFIIVLLITGYVSLGSILGAVVVVATTWILFAVGYTGDNGLLIYLIGKPDIMYSIVITLVAILLIYKHKSNIKRLLNGTESSFKKKKI